MPELQFKPWKPPKQKRKIASPAAPQPSQQRLGPTQDPAQSNHMSQNGVEPVSYDQINQTQRFYTDIFPTIDISGIDGALLIPNADIFAKSSTINHGLGPINLTGPSHASPALAQLDFPYNNASNTMDRPPRESEDSDRDVKSDSQARHTQTPISSPEHIYERSAGAEDCTTVSGLSTDAPLGSSTNDPSPSSGNRARIDTHLEGLSRDASDNASQSLDEHVSEALVYGGLRLKKPSYKVSLTCNGSSSHSAETSILSPSCTEQDLVGIGGPPIRENSLMDAPIAPFPSRDHAPDHLAEGPTNLTSEECTRDNDCPTPSDYMTSRSWPNPTRTKKRLTDPDSRGVGSDETRKTKRQKRSTLPSQSTLRNSTSTRTLRLLLSRTRVHSGKTAPNGANSRLSRSPHALRRPFTNRPRNLASKKYRVKEPPTPDHYRRRGSSTYEAPVQPKSPTSQIVGHSAFRAPIVHNQNLPGGHHHLNAPNQVPHNLARNESGHLVQIPSKSSTFADSRPLAIQCNTCGFCAEHILPLTDYVEGLLRGGDKMPTMRLFLGFIRDYATQRRTYENSATACNCAYVARVRDHTSNSSHVSTPDNSEHNGSHDDTSNTNSSGEDSDESISCQSKSSGDREHNGICDDESAIGNSNEDNDDSVSYNGVSKCKRGRWSRLDEARLRAWVKENQGWPWMAKKLGRTSEAVSNHWKVILEREAKV